MSLDPASRPQDAAVPFSGASDDDTHAPDFIVRSSDGVDFHLHRDILKFASACFDSMLASPPSEDDLERDGKPVVVVPEAEAVLYRLFSLAYPPQSLKHFTVGADNLDGLVAVRSAAHKYQFPRVLNLLADMLDNASLIDAAPHRLFALGRLWSLPSVARKAALSTLKHPLHPTPAFPEMHQLTWADGHALSEFHHSCRAEANRRLSDNRGPGRDYYRSYGERTVAVGSHGNWFAFPEFVWWSTDPHGTDCTKADLPDLFIDSQTTRMPMSWFSSHLARIQACVQQVPGHNTILTGVATVSPPEQKIIDACPRCAEHAKKDLAEFAVLLARGLETFNTALAEKMF
ncbi:hypothetical protein C8R46DRAFT_523719 [Mycena filopes]|nr:hypothetical protein C8R46DRAFT_523719 [Mycena filopes]